MEEYASKILAMRNQICSEKKWSFELLQGVDTLPGFLPWGIKKKLNNNKKKKVTETIQCMILDTY